MAAATIEVSHLGGTTVGYTLSGDGAGVFDPSKPTFVLVNAMYMTAALYADQLADEALAEAANLVAIEPLGHGATTCPSEHWTSWDSAIVALQAMEGLGVETAFALGTSQGGWIVARMALLAPEKVKSLVLLFLQGWCDIKLST